MPTTPRENGSENSGVNPALHAIAFLLRHGMHFADRIGDLVGNGIAGRCPKEHEVADRKEEFFGQGPARKDQQN